MLNCETSEQEVSTQSPARTQSGAWRQRKSSLCHGMRSAEFIELSEDEGSGDTEAHKARLQPSAAELASAQLSPAHVRQAERGSYPMQLLLSPDSRHLAASLTNDSIMLYHVKSDSLQPAGCLPGHTGTIHEMVAAAAGDPNLLHSCSADGTVRTWDLRSGRQTQRLAAEQEGQELLSLAVSGHTVAAGAEGSILFWDRRTGTQAAVFDDTHSESVTQLLFHPTKAMTLVSGSTDGLIAVHDLQSGFDDEEAFQAALNLVSVARMGFYGSQQEKLWCTSNVESLHLWEWAAACEEDAPGGEGPLCSLEDARADLTKVLTKSAHGVPKEAELDYLISCQPVGADQLWVAAGSTTGFTGCFSVSEPASSGQPCHIGGPLLMTGQHTDIVRSLVWFDAEERRCISGGEDGKIIVWHAADEDIPVEQALKRQRLH